MNDISLHRYAAMRVSKHMLPSMAVMPLHNPTNGAEALQLLRILAIVNGTIQWRLVHS